MNILNKFTIKSLKLNKKRTIVTIIGIMLSTALICGVAGLVSSFQNSLIDWARTNDGNYHVTFKNVESNKAQYVTENQKVKDYFISSSLGWANLEGSKATNKPYLHVLAYDKKALENYGVVLTDGRLPQNPNEIIITESVLTGARVFLKIGDTITLNIGTRKSNDDYYLNGDALYTEGDESIVDTKEKTYTIVGFMETLDVETLYSPGYSALTYMDETPSAIDISVLYKSPKEYEKTTKDICKTLNLDFDEDIYVNSDFLRFQGIMSDNMLYVLYTIAGVVIFIIVISSVFVIRNSFSISVAEKNRQYGMLSSVGATSKQIRRNVIFEGMVIGLIAIPLGILLGIVAIMILLKVVNYLLTDMLSGLGFTYSINLLAVLISVAISIITIYLSCFIPARRAAKISPIESIRGNNDIKINSKKLRTSKLTKKLFGIGGVIASKNLKRSKKKYRTTVISLVISIFIFISLSSFLTLGTKTSQFYYMDFKFNVYVHSLSDANTQIYEKISKLENVDNSAYYYQSSLDIDNIKYASEFGKKFLENDPQPTGIAFMVYNNEYFKKYIKEIGLKESDYKTAVILLDYDTFYNEDGSKTVDRIYSLKSGDKVNVKSGDKEKTLTISKFTDVKPMGQEAVYYDHGIIVVSEDYIKEVFKEDVNNSDYYHLSDLFIKSSKPQELENTLNDLIKQGGDYYGLTVFNYETYMKQEQRMLLVVKIFLYGFITVITLIGVTNIFNTITTNMILRSKEFAMLKSVGMSSKEFNKMIRLESIMYGTKSLLIGIPLGILGSYGMYKAFAQGIDLGYTLPLPAIIISIIFVFIIVGITMKYSLNKINKQNIIETIRKDNI
jgi:putative ABC transport system permease protein